MQTSEPDNRELLPAKKSGEALLLAAVFVVGLSGITAQIVLLRELLVSFSGNELTIGVILANWIILEAAGAFIAGKLLGRNINGFALFTALQIAFLVFLPASVFLARTFKGFLGIPFAEAAGLWTIFISSLIITFPVSFCHGALFSVSCKIISSLGKAYAWEGIGTFCGGLILGCLFLPFLSSFQIAFIVSSLSLITCLFFLKHLSRRLKYLLFALIILMPAFISSGAAGYLQKASVSRQWRPHRVLDYRNSIYGNIAVSKEKGQLTFFYNGIPLISSPHPDKQFAQEFGNIPLLFLEHPKEILILSGGAGGLINEVLKHPVKRIDYVELDPLLIQMLRRYPSELTQRELADNRVEVINSDGRHFLKNSKKIYDVILIGLSRPSDLNTNRFFTQEFFSLASQRLSSEGLIAFCLPGSLTYISREIRDLNACVLNGLNNAFAYVRVIPGDSNMFLASNSREILEVEQELITRRIKGLGIKADILLPGYLDYRLDRQRLDWFRENLRSGTQKVNQDLSPFAVFQMLIFWNKQFSSGLSNIFGFFGNMRPGGIIFFFLIIALLLSYVFARKRTKRRVILYSIATTGFLGMILSLILLFSFQTLYGYLYYMIGALMSFLMAGISLGSILMVRKGAQVKHPLKLFMLLEVFLILLTCALALIIGRFSWVLPYWAFAGIFLLTGTLMGLEFVLAGSIYQRRDGEEGDTAGSLYAADLIGGWAAGIVGSVLLLPLLGLFNACLVVVLFKLSSLLPLALNIKRV